MQIGLGNQHLFEGKLSYEELARTVDAIEAGETEIDMFGVALPQAGHGVGKVIGNQDCRAAAGGCEDDGGRALLIFVPGWMDGGQLAQSIGGVRRPGNGRGGDLDGFGAKTGEGRMLGIDMKQPAVEAAV